MCAAWSHRYNQKARCIISAAVPLPQLFLGHSVTAGGQGAQADMEGLEFEGEAGKAAELNPIGVAANSLAAADADKDTASVSADSRKELVRDSLYTGEDEIFAFRRAISRVREMGSIEYTALHAGLRLGS